MADSDGTNATPFLSSPGLDFDASFSADAKWVIFASTRDENADIYRAHSDGSALEKLVTNASYDGQASLSPDGKTLAFVSSRTGGGVNFTSGAAGVRGVFRHPLPLPSVSSSRT